MIGEDPQVPRGDDDRTTLEWLRTGERAGDRMTPEPELARPATSHVAEPKNAFQTIDERDALERPRPAIRARIVAGAMMGALGVLALVMIARRRRSRRPERARRSVAASVGRELGKEIASRVLVSAASVVAARVANDVLAPMIVARMNARSATSERP